MKRITAACMGLALLVLSFLTSCVEDIDKSNRYTFIGQTVGQHLLENDEVYGSFNYILNRAGKMNLLKAYGRYTVFAPTNEAIARYLVEQDSIWRKSLEPGSKKEIWTGITSPVLEDLSDSMCVVIANTHILAAKLFTTDMEGDVVPAMNLNDRYLTMTFDVDENLHPVMYVNGARLIVYDEEMENGVVHTVASALSPSTNTVPAQIEEMKFLSLFYEALQKTGLEDKMQLYKDENYKPHEQIRKEAQCGGDLPYPPSRYYGYTAFCEPNEVFNELGIYTIDDLYRQCQKWYPDATDDDFTSENNALYKFMAYHLLDYHLLYTRLVFYNISGNTIQGNGSNTEFNSEIKFGSKNDRFEYYETFQGTLLKIIMPRSSDISGTDRDGVNRPLRSTILLNFGREAVNTVDPFNSTAGRRQIPVGVRIMDPAEIAADTARYPNYSQEALNGSIHLIDRPLVYDEDVMLGYVFDGPIRIDYSALLPELTNNHMRWFNGAVGVDFPGDVGFYIPDGYSDRFKVYNEKCNVSYMLPRNGWSEYQGDLICCVNQFDFAFRLPNVPEGTYEIRISAINQPGRSYIQYYLDNEICGIPVNHNLYATDPSIGYVADNQTDDNGVDNDKIMKNHGYLKLPISYYRENGYGPARTWEHGIRYVVTTKYLKGGDHWLRIKNVNDDPSGYDYNHADYIEIVPLGWLRREDLSLEEKRK